MRILTLPLSCLLLALAGAPLHAQTEYTAKGGNAFVSEVTGSLDLPDGTTRITVHNRGFIWNDGEPVVGGNGSMDCIGSNILSAEGEPMSGAGTCEAIDLDGDIWWVWWNGAAGGDFGFTGGTGKYTGITGGGSWMSDSQYADGKVMNKWEGSWTIPASDMAMPEMK